MSNENVEEPEGTPRLIFNFKNTSPATRLHWIVMRVIIAGGRDVKGDRADTLVCDAIANSGWTHEIVEVIHGAALGIDSAAHRVCEGISPKQQEHPDWLVDSCGGMIRRCYELEYEPFDASQLQDDFDYNW